jgi:hypothetical protein
MHVRLTFLTVTQNMHDQTAQNTQAVLRLRGDQFDLMTRILGCESDAARAELIGVNWRTVSRAKAGAKVGEVFIAQTIASLRRETDTLGRYGLKPTLDNLFEVVDAELADAEPASAAA